MSAIYADGAAILYSIKTEVFSFFPRSGLTQLVKDTVGASYPDQYKRWLLKEYATISGSDGCITQRDFRKWLPQANYRLSRNEDVRHWFERNQSGKADFKGFNECYHHLVKNCCRGT